MREPISRGGDRVYRDQIYRDRPFVSDHDKLGCRLSLNVIMEIPPGPRREAMLASWVMVWERQLRLLLNENVL